MKIVTIVGARPQFVKAAVISREFLKHEDIKEVIVHTGQHFDKNMSAVFFEEMQIPQPNYNLAINGLSHGAMTGQMLEKIEEALLIEKPDWVLVYGDTNSTLAGALAAKKLHIKLAHIEAGLRSFNMKMPEEINRILTDRISNVLFCPTQTAVNNLKDEGFDTINATIKLPGDVMKDAALFYNTFAIPPKDFQFKNNFILATIHRAENTESKEKLSSIFETIAQISKETPVVLPLHPRTKAKLTQFNIEISDTITVLPPVGYLEMVYLLNNCTIVVTDSGGVQKEAFFFKKPCVTLRNETEWVELVENGYNTLTGSDKSKIIYAVNKFNTADLDFNKNLYGKGNAAKEIVNYLVK